MVEEFDDEINEELMDQDDYVEFDDYEDDTEIEMLNAILKSASKSADKLTSLIVENNYKNNVTMSNEDIYDIYRNSFIVALTTIAPPQSE